MLGQTGGKVEQRQVNGDPASLYAAVENFINAREGSVIKTQFPPQQITAGIVFKDFMATMNAPVKVDSEINIAPTGPGVSTVTVGGKADFGSATSLWIFSLIMFLVGFLFISALLFIILGIGSAVFQVYLLNSRGPRIVADELFEYLNKQVSHTAPSQDMSHDSAASAPAPKSSPMVAEAGNGAATQKNGAAPSTLTQRIRKLDELKDEGLINDEEYNTRRMEILQEI